MKTDLSTYNNDWFTPTVGASKIKQVLWYFTNAIFFTHHFFPYSSLKVFLLRLFGAEVGQGVIIKPAVNIKYPWKLQIRDNSWIGEKVWIDNLAEVVIGANCCVSQGALLLTGNHDFTKRGFDLIVRPIVMEDGAWIGARATVCPGVTCGSHSILTAGSIATRNLEAYTVNQGNPAVAIKERIIQ